LKRPRTSKIWKELGDALRLGCSMKAGVATAPSFQDQLGGERDPYETLIALPGAVLRERPTERSAVLRRLKWHLLMRDGIWDGRPWVRVKLADGRRGYVHEKMARSPIDYRAWFDRRGGRWRMAGFLAGD
jgi:hypothetical protein